ncbi:MAG: hypothetical protein ACYCPF_15340, partial [Streptosporangiaceae bacterium]
LEQAFETILMSQGPAESRSLDETLGLAWRVLAELPRRDLTMVFPAAVSAHYPGAAPEPGDPDGGG